MSSPAPIVAVSLLMSALAWSCGGSTPTTTFTSSDGPTSEAPSVPVGTSDAPTPTATSGSPAGLPAGIPPSYDDDVSAADVPPDALVPPGTEVTGAWYGRAHGGEAIVVSWLVPGRDPLRLAHGLAVWRRFAGEGAPWRPVAGETWPRRSGVLGIDVLLGDLTDDGSDDALVLAQTGGSGACGTYTVVDIVAAASIFERDVCDTTIQPASPPGLLVREAVFGPDDAHCCPSAFRETRLTYAGGGGWTVASRTETPAG